MDLIVIFLLLALIIVICFQLVWLYTSSQKGEANKRKQDETKKRINLYFSALLNSPTELSFTNEYESFCKYVKEDCYRWDEACNKLIEAVSDEDITDEQEKILIKVYKFLNPSEYYGNILETGNKYRKAYASRKLAIFGEQKYIPQIEKLLKSSDEDVYYNAAMALSELGCEEQVVKSILLCRNNYTLSHRIIIELLNRYTGDMNSLAKKLLDNCDDDYISATVIKGVAEYGIQELEDYYLKGLDSKYTDMIVACIHALGVIGKPSYKQFIIMALHNQKWIVRVTAVKALQKIGGSDAIQAVYEATGDKEWWVRYSAAKALVEMDDDLVYVEKVLSGYDKYATEAVKSVLYKEIKIN